LVSLTASACVGVQTDRYPVQINASIIQIASTPSTCGSRMPPRKSWEFIPRKRFFLDKSTLYNHLHCT